MHFISEKSQKSFNFFLMPLRLKHKRARMLLFKHLFLIYPNHNKIFRCHCSFRYTSTATVELYVVHRQTVNHHISTVNGD